MLVLSRTRGERIILDGTITLTVVDVTASTVRLGIDAPKDVRILREELTLNAYPGPQGDQHDHPAS